MSGAPARAAASASADSRANPRARSACALKPLAYRATQWLLAPRADEAIRDCARRVIGDPARVGPSLDVGCGPQSLLCGLGLRPVGVDVSPEFVAAFARSGPAVRASATALPFRDACFDLVWTCGLLHHLADADAARALSEMARVARPGARVVVFDGVRPESVLRRPVAALVRHFDRGPWMRRHAALQAIFAQAPLSWASERVTYTATGLEGVLAVAVKR